MAPNPGSAAKGAGSPVLHGTASDANSAGSCGLDSLSLAPSHPLAGAAHYSDFVKISCLLSSLRSDPSHPRYESVSQSAARIAKTYAPLTLPRAFSFAELSAVTGSGSGDGATDTNDTAPATNTSAGAPATNTSAGAPATNTSAGAPATNTSATDTSASVSAAQTDPRTVTVFGWCKSIRKQDGGRLLFVIVNDGSCRANLQVVVHQDAGGFEQALKAHSGASVRARGFLVDRFKGGGEGQGASSQGAGPKPTESAAGSTAGQGAPESAASKDAPVGAPEYELLETVANKFELHVTSVASNFVQVLGANLFPNRYPISKKSVTLEHLREVAHLRPRSYLISAVMRVRSALALATHLFFQSLGCAYLHAPLITTADCEGAGELFQVTTLLENVFRLSDLASRMGVDSGAGASVTGARTDSATTPESGSNVGTTTTQGTATETTNATPVSDTNTDTNTTPDTSTNTGTNTGANTGGHTAPGSKPPLIPNSKISFKNDFFKKKSYLTCSGQLSAENYCCSMGSVYTFGPTFRAENSHTSRHLAEFWMIEPELVLVDLPGLMEVTERFVKFLVGYALDHCLDDLHFFSAAVDASLLDRLRAVTTTKFAHVSYTAAIDLLKRAVAETPDTPKFEFNDVRWGMDLQSEHERYLSEEVFGGPVIIYDYPKAIKAFYMRRNDDNRTVAAMDLIIPKIGELIGGSQREERLEFLLQSIRENNLSEDDYWWYLDLRRYGTVVHSGFGLGFERLVMMVTGVTNIRDVIPFPRYPGHSSF